MSLSKVAPEARVENATVGADSVEVSPMQKLPVVRLFVYTTLTAIVTGALGYAVCVETNNFTAMSVVMFLSVAIGMTLVLRWWIPVNRAMGIPATKPTRDQWLLMIALFVSMIAAVVIEHVAFQFTKSRLAKVAAAICTIVPIGFVVVLQSHRWVPAVSAKELRISRLNFYLQLGLPVLFSFNLFMQLTERHIDQPVSGLREWVLPLYFAYLAMWPFSITMLRRRYLKAEALKDSEPPDRWRTYKNELASNE